MPKKVLIHPNERVDITDFTRAANDYTSESVSFDALRSILDHRARVLEGFRIEISDQSANPGQFTVYNGTAYDRDGKILNNEDQVNDANTITLPGASTTYYIEVEFVETDSDTDARAFWDPTFDQAAPTPDGKEFSINVATRISPDWQIVTPVSTTAFDVTTNPSSTRIPLAVLATDPSIEITGAVNPGLVSVFASTVLENDVSIGATTVDVLDSRLFPDTGTITVDVGGASPEAGLAITAVDRVNHRITFSPGLASAHLAGAIVRVTSGVAQFMRQRTSASESLTAHSQPDVAPRLWQGDEVRGSALSTSKETFGDRDDTQLKVLKDYVDFVAAQIREVKFGALRSDDTSELPPSSFSSEPRYFEASGGVQGARHHTISIGNGTTSFGDLNGTDEAPFVEAVAALPASGGTIYVKEGTYTFTATVTLDKPVKIVGENEATTSLAVSGISVPLITVDGADNVIFEDISLSQAGGVTDTVIDVVDGPSVEFSRVTQVGNLVVTAGSGAFTINARKWSVNGLSFGGGNAAVQVHSARALGGSITDSSIDAGTGNDCISAVLENLRIAHSDIHEGGNDGACITILGDSSNIYIEDCDFNGTKVFTFVGGTPTVTNLQVRSLVLSSHAATVVGPIFEFYFLAESSFTDVLVDNLNYSSTTSGTPGRVFYIEFAGDNVSFSRCEIVGNGLDFITAIDSSIATSLFIDSCVFQNCTIGLRQRVDCNVFIKDTNFSSQVALDTYGVWQDSLVLGRVQIHNNIMTMGTGSVAVGIRLEGIITGVIGNNAIRGGSSGSTDCNAIKLDGSVVNLAITGNILGALKAANGSRVAGIFSEGANCFGLTVTGNTFSEIGSTATSNTANALYVATDDNITELIFSDNVVSLLSSTAIAPAVDLSWAAAPTEGIQISNNVFRGSGGVGTGVSGGLIQLLSFAAAASLTDCIISDNLMDMSGRGSIRGISLLLEDTASNRNITVVGNTILCSADTEQGIRVSSRTGSGAAYTDLTVDNNIVSNVSSSLSANTGCIDLHDASFSRISISGNTVQEEVFNSFRFGIRLESSVSGNHLRISNNTLHGKSGSRSTGGIVVDNMQDIAIASNTVEWVPTPTDNGFGIRLVDCVGGTISGNYVVPDDAFPEISTTGSSDNFVVVGNNCGTTANPGSIILAGADNLEASNKTVP